MCSHESIVWKITDNSVTDRMIDSSLIHEFRPSRSKIRRRTKVLNAELKKHHVMDYRHYVELKTNVLRNLTTDTDTSDSSNLTDNDYDIIYSSPSKQTKYVAESSEKYNFISDEDCKGCKRKNKYRKSQGSGIKKRIQIKKSRRTNTMTPKEYIDVGWQEVKKSNTACLCEQVCTNILDNEGNKLKDDDNNLKAQCRKQSLSPQFDSQNNRTRITKYENKYMKQNHGKYAVDNELNSRNNTISGKTKSVSKRKAQNHKNQSEMNESNTKFNSHDSHYQLSPSRSISLENSNNFNNESNTFVQAENNSSKKLMVKSNESSINTKNYGNTYVSHKPELLKNVRRNLISTLEKADSTNNKDIETEKNVNDSNYDELLLTAISSNQHSTPIKKIETNVPKVNDLPPNISPLDQQKDSGIDDDSQDRYEIKGSKIAKNRNTKKNAEKIPISSPELKKIDEVIKTEEDCEKDEKEVHSKFSKDFVRDQINKEEKLSGEKEIKNSSELNQIDVNVEINQEDKKDEHFAKKKELNNIQKQQLLSPKQDCMKDAHSESCKYMREEEDDRKVKESVEEEEEISLRLNENEKEIFSINHENSIKLEDSCDIQNQQVLPKVMCSEILNKRYKIIDKKDSNAKNNIKTIDNNTDIAKKYIPIKKNTLIHRDIIDHNTDNCQEAAINSEEIDAPIALETDNEEINVNYISSQTKKRLQQQARLNLVVSSDSNESNRNGESETKTSEYRTQASVKSHSNAHVNISCQYRPCNLEELVEDQELLVETMPASFTLKDLSQDEEAFILNVPNKVIQCNLQGQLLMLKKNSIKFNKSKYRIVHKEVGTTSCLFATGKKQKPYKLINIKEISTITVREILPQDSRKTDVSNSISSVPKQIKINNQETDEADSKMLKVLNHEKCKRRKNSDFKIGHL